ncbi:MAG: 50S ribosomal protein L17 [Candidatus Margulisiibacteriota bacterium]
MRHKRKIKKLNKPTEGRLAMLYAQTTALFEHEKIKMTVTRAKQVRRISDRLISKAKKDSVHNRRMMARVIKDAKLIGKICEMAKNRYEGRPGGYTRITRIGLRRGDATPMCVLELV